MDIFEAAKTGDEGGASRLLDADPTLLQEGDAEGNLPLTTAAHFGQLGVVKLLVDRGANLDALTRSRRTALHGAVQQGHEAVVGFLLSKAAQTNIHDDDHMTPLMLAAGWGHVGVAQMLLQHTGGQGVDEQGPWSRTALHLAAHEGDEAMAALLLSHGASTNIRAFGGMTPLMLAASAGRVGVVQMLQQHMGEFGLEETDERGRTALCLAAQWGHEETVIFLLSKGARAFSRDEFGRIPLMWAAYRGRMGMVQSLMQHMGGHGLEARDGSGGTVLHWAAEGGHQEIVRYLLLSGADPTITDGQGRMPQALAWSMGHLESSRVFYRWGGELKRRYQLQRARSLHDAHKAHQEKRAAPVPSFLQERAAEWEPLPKVKVVVVGQQEEQAGPNRKRKASSEEAGGTKEEEEIHAVLGFVVRQLNEQLFTELMQGFHAPGGYSNALAGEISDTEDEEEYEEEYEEESEDPDDLFWDEWENEGYSSGDHGYCDEEDYEGEEWY